MPSALLFPGQGSHAPGMDEAHRGKPLFERGLKLLGYGLVDTLTVSLPRVDDPDQAQQLLDTAHQVCPYSNAIRGNVDVTLTLA